MRNQINSAVSTLKSTLSAAAATIPNSVIFALDTFSMTLFAFAIFSLINHIPEAGYIAIKIVFITLTSFMMILFLSRRAYLMAILKLSMLLSLFAIDTHIYYI